MTGYLLTKEDVAKRWQVSIPTIDRYIAEGILVPVKALKVIRFNPDYIASIEGFVPEPKSWVEIKLENENKDLREQIKCLEKTISNIMNQCTSINVKGV